MEDFYSLDLPKALVHALDLIKFNKPTPIQAQTIPLALNGADILGSAQTGTGKTGAYSIPLIAWLMKSPSSCALILAPTRELAAQVRANLEQFTNKDPSLKTALLIGGDPYFPQMRQLRARPRIVVGTPGRINDHLNRGSLSLSRTDFLVLDETDRMLDMGFGVQLQEIVHHLPEQRQTLMFSATLPPSIVKLSAKYLKNPAKVHVGSALPPLDKIKQTEVFTTDAKKYNLLQGYLCEHKESFTIVFVKTKRGAEALAAKLCQDQYNARAIHGDLQQRSRTKIITDFRNRQYHVLVATDVAARGLDIPHIECVINYDLPQSPEDYVHRIGRTGRAEAKGVAVSLIAPQDQVKWKRIDHLINPGKKVASAPYPKHADGQKRHFQNKRKGGGSNKGGIPAAFRNPSGPRKNSAP